MVVGRFPVVADAELYEQVRERAEECAPERLKKSLERYHLPLLRPNHQDDCVEELDGGEGEADSGDDFVVNARPPGAGSPARIA